tara:strand:- start:111 stop:449 length:339 start_codon:yes stop_codon:yes gene_type:complete
MIGSGRDSYDSEFLSKLADFRDRLKEERDKSENRVHGRNRNGITLVKRDGSVGVGPYTMDYRKKLLDRLESLQSETSVQIITEEEKLRIVQLWAEEQANLSLFFEGKLEVVE